MCVRLLCNFVFATACSLALPFTSPSAAMEEPNPKEAVVEFVEIPGQPPAKYDMKIVVELVGTQKVVENDKITIGAGMSAKGTIVSPSASAGNAHSGKPKTLIPANARLPFRMFRRVVCLLIRELLVEG